MSHYFIQSHSCHLYFLLHQLNLLVIVNWAMYNPIYLNCLIMTITSSVTLVMLLIAMNGPKILLQFFDNSRFGFLFTFRGRYCMDLFVSLFLYAMEVWGILMANVTLGMVFGIRFAGVRHPEAFRILFRQTADYDDDGTVYTDAGDTYDGTYDGTYEGTLESGRR